MQIQNLQEDDLNLFFHHAKRENWDIEEIHIRTLLKTNPDDFFIFYEDGQLIGFVVALKESEEFGFISSMLVVEEFRGLGYGKEIFSCALKHLKGRQIALDSVLGQESFYEKFGFKEYFDVLFYRFMAGTITLPPTDYELIEFDKELSLKDQSYYMKLLLQEDQVAYKAIKKENSISSFAFSFTYKDGYKISINAEDINEAVTLFLALAKQHKMGTNIYIQVTRLSPLLEALTEVLQMSEVSKMSRMYNKILS